MSGSMRALGGFVAALALAGCSVFGGGKDKPAEIESRTFALGINGYLWRAALDTLSFMPMSQVDSDGGVIITDWYVNPDVPTERLRVTVYVLDRDLRADALRVAVFREVASGGDWVSAPVRAGTASDIENAILNRARELRQPVLGED